MRALRVVVGAVVFLGVASCSPGGSESSPSGGPTTGGGASGGVKSSGQALAALRPVVGGHLLVSADKSKVLLADPEGDRLRIYDLGRMALSADVQFPRGSWPTRIAEGAGKYFVTLRGTGELATVGASGTSFNVVSVCAEPRAVTLGATMSEAIVGCAGGELVRVSDNAVTARATTDVEWRDLTFGTDGVKGTSFRAGEYVTLARFDGATPVRLKAPAQRVSSNALDPVMHQAQVAWRMVPAGSRTFVVQQFHADQIHVDQPLPNSQGTPPTDPYGGSPGGPSLPGQPPVCTESAVVTGITTVGAGGALTTVRTNDVLPVDAALSPDGSLLAVVGAGGTGLSIYATALIDRDGPCLTPTAGLAGLALNSVAWVSGTRLVVLESLRSTPMLFDMSTGASNMLGNESDRSSPAHALFHTAPRGGAALACASCHPEGGEDGHVWVIDGKQRRTQSLAGGVMARAPFHWRGDLNDLNLLMADTFQKRMGGQAVPGDQVAALGTWLNTIPAPRASVTLTADARSAGVAAFTKAGCATCHLENGLKEGAASDIGTGEAVRAPSLLGLQARAPYLHTGEVPDIRTRVTGSLHPQHGNLAALSAAEKETLISYLQSL